MHPAGYVLLVLIVLVAVCFLLRKDPEGYTPRVQSDLNYKDELKKVFYDRVYWTRMAAFSLINNVVTASDAVKRLARNEKDLAFVIGERRPDTQDKLETLLHENTELLVKYIKAAPASGKSSDLSDIESRLQQNVDEIAETLPGDYASNKSSLYDMLSLTESEIKLIAQGDTDGSSEKFSSLTKQAYDLAEDLSSEE